MMAVFALSTTIVLSACGGSSGDSSSNTASILTDNDFEFPALLTAGQGAGIEVPVGDAPEFSARRTLSKGVGSTIEFGDPVVLNYNMYSWSTGELVETTDSLDEAVTIIAGVSEGVPDFLTKSLLGRNIGDQLQVVFERDMEDLPGYLDNSDAYVVVVDLL